MGQEKQSVLSMHITNLFTIWFICVELHKVFPRWEDFVAGKYVGRTDGIACKRDSPSHYLFFTDESFSFTCEVPFLIKMPSWLLLGEVSCFQFLHGSVCLCVSKENISKTVWINQLHSWWEISFRPNDSIWKKRAQPGENKLSWL